MHQQSKENTTATSTTQHQAITHSSSKHHSTITTHHGDFTETCPRRDQHITERSPKHHQNNTETSPKKDRDKTETRPRHHRDISKALRKQDGDINMTPPKQHGDVTETSSRHPRDTSKALRKQDRDITVAPRDITQATQNQDRHITETRPRHDREHEFFNLEASSVDIRGHSYTGLPKDYNIQIEIGISDFAYKSRSKCSSVFIPSKLKHHHQSKRKQHCNINDTTPRHHPLIIINITAPSPHITETSPKHARDVTNTSLKNPQNTTKKPTKQHHAYTR